MTATVPAAPNETMPLDALAVEIRQQHEAVEAGVRATLAAAVRCGGLLAQAKAQVRHGGWGAWLGANFPASERTARAYMRAAAHYSNRQLPADLTLEGALRQLAPAAKVVNLPPLTAAECSRLRESIARVGVLVPIVRDQHGNLLDGNHRKRIADELGVKYRVDTIQVADEQQARELRVTLNLARRP